MVSGIEGVGEAVSGGMIARAVEPAAGEARGDEGGNCLNCGAALAGPYCHICGQRGHVHRTLGAFWHDLLHGALHFEGKIWRTLPLLAWRPGELTRRYVEGERARFVSPVALFLFSVFLMFAVFSTVGGPFAMTAPIASAEDIRNMQDRAEALRARIAGIEAQKRALALRGQPTAEVDRQLAVLGRQRQAIEATRRLVRAPAGQAHGAAGKSEAADLSDLTADTGWPWLDRQIEHIAENPSLFAYKLQSSAYKFSWALIPISVPFVWLMFVGRRRFKAYDHTIFVTYSIAFMTLLVVALSLIRAITGSDGPSGFILAFLPPIHMFRQLKGAYSIGWAGALWRTLALLVFALVAALLFFLLMLAVGLAG